MNANGNVQTVVLGIIALVILVPVGIVCVLLVQQNHADTAIALIGPIAGSVVGFYFGHQSGFLAQNLAQGSQAAATGMTGSLVDAVRALSAAAVTPTSTAAPTAATASPTPATPTPTATSGTTSETSATAATPSDSSGL